MKIKWLGGGCSSSSTTIFKATGLNSGRNCERDFGCVSTLYVRWFSRSIELTPFSESRSSVSKKGMPEDVKSRVLGLHEDNVQLREQLKTKLVQYGNFFSF
jgi:hypothetical protein